MKKIVIAALAGLAALAGAVLVAPNLIDWNAYKGAIAERVSAATGRKVELRGDIGLTLLPSPALTVRDARLANPPGAAEPDMARLKKLDARVALGPLLTGRIQVESITLVEPTFVVEVLKDGRVNWDLSGGPAAGSSSLPSADGLASAVSFDRVSVEGGTILYRDDRSGRVETLEAVSARIVAGSLAGPFQFQGDFRLRGLPLHGEGTAGRFTDGAAVPVRAALSLPGTDSTLRFAGILSGGSGNPNGSGALRAQGDLRAEGGDLAKLFDAKAPTALAQPFSLRAAVEAGTSLATFTNVEAQLGDTRATGTATLRAGDPARTELTLVVNRLDLDSWLAKASGTGAARGAPAAAPSSGNGRAGSSTPTAAPSPILPAFALPAGVEGKLDLAVDGLTYNGGVVRQGRLEASLGNGRLNIDRISALLPGGSDVVAAGEVTTPGGQPTVDLRMEANADNLRALLDWMRLDVQGVAAGRLRRASIAGRIQGHADRFELSGLDLRVDSSRLSGAIAYVDRGRPAFGARLELDRLNLDAYLPSADPAPATAPATAAAPGPGPAAGPTAASAATLSAARATLTPQRLLGMADANLDLTIGQLTLHGLPVQGIHLDATAAGGALTIREARVDDLVGLKGRIDGQIAGLSPLRGVNIALSADAANLGGLPSAFPWPAGVPVPERLGAVTAKARLAGDAGRLALELTAGMAGGTLEAGGALLALDKTPAADVKLRVSYPELGRIAALFADRPLVRAYGPLDLYGELGGTAQAPTLGNLQGIVAGTALRGKLSAVLGEARPRLDAEIQTGDLDIDRLLAAPLAADPAGGEPGSGPPPAQGGASVALAAPVGGSGGTSWLRSLDGRLALTATSLTAGGLRIDQPALRAGLTGGILTLEQLDGEWLGGQIGLSGRVVETAGRAPSVEADVTVVKAALSEVAAGSGMALAGGTVDLSLTLTSSGTDRATLLHGLAGRGRVAAAGGTLRGLDLAALRDRLARIDRPQEVLGAVAGSLQGGETRIDRLDGRFVIDHGIVRTEDTRLSSAAGEGLLSGQWSLPEERVDFGLTVKVKATPPLPPLTLRVVGPAAAPTQSLDMQAVQEHFARAAKP
ncbi:AsmA family protein [Azospirillum agricola]|uniref:AsmA family protein n=1 Tax=Azospirillum agricola TaxID=1720247 RepID=UPI000A1CE055|nr:AsmA family protein [Azospirillum agricola]